MCGTSHFCYIELIFGICSQSSSAIHSILCLVNIFFTYLFWTPHWNHPTPIPMCVFFFQRHGGPLILAVAWSFNFNFSSIEHIFGVCSYSSSATHSILCLLNIFFTYHFGHLNRTTCQLSLCVVFQCHGVREGSSFGWSQLKSVCSSVWSVL